jgi:hypothetical protein
MKTRRPDFVRMKYGVTVFNPNEIPVSFTPDELAELKGAAVKIDAFKAANRKVVRQQRHNRQRDNTDVTYVGLIGEAAVGKHLGLPVDTSASLSGDLVKDFTYCGMTVEVKTSVGVLPFNSVAHFRADLAILVNYSRVDYATVWIQGWITRQIFREFHFIRTFGFGDRACMQPASLRPMKILRAWCLEPNRRCLREDGISTGWID